MGPGEGCVRGLLQYSAGKGRLYVFHHAVRCGRHLMIKPGLLRRSLSPVIGRQRHSPNIVWLSKFDPGGERILRTRYKLPKPRWRGHCGKDDTCRIKSMKASELAGAPFLVRFQRSNHESRSLGATVQNWTAFPISQGLPYAKSEDQGGAV
jgi:hypothetical protein